MAHEHGQNAHATILPDKPGTLFRGGVIRFSGNRPELHVNSSHQSIGIIPSSVRINNTGDLEFRMDRSLPVVTLWASADETLVARKIAGGISGGGSTCIVRLSRADMGIGEKLNLNLPGHYGRVKGPTSNIWVGVVSYWDGKS
ncbi:hypothetical protein [Citricoccus sp. NR2]|uniref:hypothetical protein n=1 Tax=Citricoccus sp. NR2 TaxID=3004095 RepID=UPI0022DD8CB2|nr:hypothetical protein [Citricoccus sp. NR2]WBL18527.1 hypothetical protein O1A05_12270 [Citricoccus sp. NR2]